MKGSKILGIKLKHILLATWIPFGLTGCLDSDGDLQGASSNESASISADQITSGTLPLDVLIGSVSQLPAPMDGSACGANQIMEWNGTDWVCINTPSVSGAPATSVSAGNITAGTIGAGVLLPSNQISGSLNPETQLNGSICADGQVLKSDGTNFNCVNQVSESILTDSDPAANLTTAVEGDVAYDTTDNELQVFDGASWVAASGGGAASSVPASGITAGTVGAGVLLPAGQLSGAINPATQVGAGALPASVTLSNTSQLPAPMNGMGCSANQMLEWSGTAWACVNQVSESILTDSDPAANLTTAVEGDVAYDTTDNELQVFDGASWVAASSGGAASSVPASGITAGTVGAGVLLPAGQLSGAINPATQIGAGNIPAGTNLSAISQLPTPFNGSGCSANQILEWNGTAWVCVNQSSTPGNNSVTSASIVDGSVTGTDVQDGSIGTADIATGSITSALLAAGSVDTVALADGSVTNAKIANGSINPTQKLDGSVCTNGQILQSDGTNFSCVTPSVADGTVDSDAIADGSIGSVDLAAGSVDSTALGADSVTSAAIADGTITSADIADGTITGTDISNNSIDATTKLSTSCADNQFLQASGGNFVCANAAGGADNLGNHTATQDLDLDDNLLVGNGGSAGIAIDASGNVGIGTTSPGAELHVADLTDSPAGLTIEGNRSADNAWSSFLYMRAPQSPAPADKKDFQLINVNNSTENQLQFRSSLDSGAQAESIMVLTHSGNVGIGTTAPTHKLHVDGEIRVGGITDYVYTNKVGLISSAGDFELNYSSAKAVFYSDLTTVGTGTMTLLRNGNVGIGTTTPASKLHVQSSTEGLLMQVLSNNGVRIQGLYFGTDLDSPYVSTIGSSGSNTGELQIGAGVSGQNGIRISAAGYVGIGTTSPGFPLEMGSGAHVTVAGVWTDASDKRLKEEISTNYSSALSKVMKLKPVRYYVCADIRDNLDGDCSGEYAEGEPVAHMGFYAQDLLKVFPESVSGTEEDGYGVSYGSLMAPVVASVQELNVKSLDQDEQILSQGAQIADLKAKNEKLESELAEIKKLLQRLPAAK